MRPTKFVYVGVCGLLGCIEPRPDATPERLEIEPARISLTVVDGVPVIQPFRATLVDSDGVERDVTDETTFVLQDGRFGSWSADTLIVPGDVLGTTTVLAGHDGLQAHVDLTVYARELRYDDAPADASLRFDGAVLDPSCAPAVSYPADGVVMPANLGELEIQWADARDDLFEVSLATTYLDTRIYTRRGDLTSVYRKLAEADWTRLAAQREPITMRVSGIVEHAPKSVCRSAERALYVTDQPLAGGLYVASATGIERFETAQPMTDPTVMFSTATWDAMLTPLVGPLRSVCLGCALTRDGSRFAVATGGNGAVYDVASHALTSVQQAWDFATFTRGGTKLITSLGGDLRVITDDGTEVTTVTSPSGYAMFDPQLSPEGRLVASVLSSGYSATLGATIEVRPFFESAGTLGEPHAIMPIVPGTASYYPTWSPDGQWIAFTRASGFGTLQTRASIWIVRADGSTPPVQLTEEAPDLDMRARFAPTVLTSGGERMFYVLFESARAFGELPAGRTQLWAAPFYPDRPVLGTGLCTDIDVQTGACPTRAVTPAFRLPMQSIATDNRVMQWLPPIGA